MNHVLVLVTLLIAQAAIAAGNGQATGSKPRRGVARAPFGATPDGQSVAAFTMTNAAGIQVRAISYGAIITSVLTPDRSGRLADIVLGFDTLDAYLKEPPYFGAVVGRYGNRIAKGQFALGGRTFRLATNNGPNHLHGGTKGFDKVVWTGTPVENATGVGVTFTRTSPDGEEGYPGNLKASVTYILTDKNELAIDYNAVTDKETPVNLTQHSYFNLAAEGDILGHELTLEADRYTPVDDTLIPTGELAAVQGTPFDFRTPTLIGARISTDNEQLRRGKGYDHNWVLNRPGPGLQRAARVVEPKSGRTLEIATTEPGVQFYSGNFLNGTITGKGGRVYAARTGMCLETQHFPDSPNHANFPSAILKPGETYVSRTVITFGVQP